MKYSAITSVTLFILISGFCMQQGIAQDDCEVKLEAIAGKYEGECRKGLADGEGTATGTDSYTGEFKKGLPDGKGTYTFANGDIYEGEFKKGEKDGEGVLRVKQADGSYMEQKGFWKSDEYIGEYEDPYEITYRTSGVLSVRVSEAENPADDGNALFIEIQHKGRTQQAPSFGLNVINGNFQAQFIVGNATKVLVTNFPFAFSLSYRGETVEFQFYQARSWNIRIDYNIQ
jgi:hypothetical protein